MVYHYQNDKKAVLEDHLYSSFLASFSAASIGAGINASFVSPSAERPDQALAAAVGGEGSTFDPSEPNAKRHRMTTTTPAMHQAHMDAARTLSRMPSIEAARLVAAAAAVAAAAQDTEVRQEQGPDSAAAASKMALLAPRPLLVVGPGQFGGQVGLLDALHPPEAIKYLTVSVHICVSL